MKAQFCLLQILKQVLDQENTYQMLATQVGIRDILNKLLEITPRKYMPEVICCDGSKADLFSRGASSTAQSNLIEKVPNVYESALPRIYYVYS